jgi:peptide/nickel transport system permease protein
VPVTIVLTVYFIATSIIGEAGLTFLGLGIQPPMPSMGETLSTGREYISESWWPVILPGVLLVIIVLFLNGMGDHLRGQLDPRGRVQRR